MSSIRPPVSVSAEPATSSRVRRTRLQVPGARLGPENPLPRFTPMRALPPMAVGPGADPEMVARISYGRLASPLPYAIHDGYTRELVECDYEAFTIENDRVRATVVPALGARVWSLRVDGRELLHVAPRVQWANFGLTGAWFAGGIEFNLGSTGHTSLSSRPWHASVVRDGEREWLRVWEWERTRDLVVQVDLSVVADRLVASTVIRNPDPVAKPLYWWTNIAVPETEQTRVLAQGEQAWRTDYAGVLNRVSVPHPDTDTDTDTADRDISYPRTAQEAADYFYVGLSETGRWVAAVEPDGRGLIQTSTAALTGRKLFLWGDGPGGRRWQEWLNGPRSRYLEVQAGRCATQMEHDQLPAGAELSWSESFGPIELAPEVIGGDYRTAVAASGRVFDPADLERAHLRWRAEVADLPPTQRLTDGSGWGHLELRLRDSPGWLALPFDPVEDESAIAAGWLSGGQVPTEALSVPPVSELWQQRLNQALTGPGQHKRADWWTAYAVAVGAHLRGAAERAEAGYRQSLAAAETAWAHRGLALLARARNDSKAAGSHYERARELAPECAPLAIEVAEFWLVNARPDKVGAVAEEFGFTGRFRLLAVQARAATGELDIATALLSGVVVPDLAEGDLALTEIWRQLHPDRPIPADLNFAMH